MVGDCEFIFTLNCEIICYAIIHCMREDTRSSFLLVRNQPVFKNRAARPDNPTAIGRDEKQPRQIRVCAEFNALPRRAAVGRMQQQSAITSDPTLSGAFSGALSWTFFRFYEEHIVEI